MSRESKYAAKLNSGKQMYGGRGNDSCCAHRITLEQLAAHKRRLRNERDTGRDLARELQDAQRS